MVWQMGDGGCVELYSARKSDDSDNHAKTGNESKDDGRQV